MPETNQHFASFDAKHAFRHKLASDGRESLAHMLMFPEAGIGGFIYPSVRATGPVKVRTYLFGPGLPEPVIEEIQAEVPADMDFDDFRVGPMLMAVREAHQTVDLAWDGERIKFNGRFEATHPPYAFSSHPGGNPPYYGDDRTEQHGTLAATYSIDGVKRQHNGFLIRDHSWGPRIWGLNQNHKWFHVVTPESSVHFFEMQAFGYTYLRGYVVKDGEMRHIASVDYKIRYDSRMIQQAVDVIVVDSDGRTVDVRTEAFATIQLDSYDPKVYLNESAMNAEIDGKKGTGWIEFCWNRDYFNFAKDYAERFARP